MKKRKSMLLVVLMFLLSIILIFPATEVKAAYKLNRSQKAAKAVVVNYLRYLRKYNTSKMGKLQKGKLGYYSYKKSYPLYNHVKSTIYEEFDYIMKDVRTTKKKDIIVHVVLIAPDAYDIVWNAMDTTLDYQLENSQCSSNDIMEYMYKQIQYGLRKKKYKIVNYNTYFTLRKYGKKWKIWKVSKGFSHLMTLQITPAIEDWGSQYGV